MISKLFRLSAVLVLSVFSYSADAQTACGAATLLEDPESDWSGTVAGLTGVGVGLPEQDILSLQLIKSSDELLSFVLKVQPFVAPVLLPNAVWYASFETPPDGDKYGVRIETDDAGTASMFSYRVAAGGLQDDGPSDGRFAEDGSEIPLEAGSGYAPDGTITLIVKPGSIGLFPPLAGQTLGPFNAATIQGANLVAVRAAFTVDEAPAGLGRDGFYDFQACSDKSGSGLALGGGLGLGLLLPLALLALRRYLN